MHYFSFRRNEICNMWKDKKDPGSCSTFCNCCIEQAKQLAHLKVSRTRPTFDSGNAAMLRRGFKFLHRENITMGKPNMFDIKIPFIVDSGNARPMPCWGEASSSCIGKPKYIFTLSNPWKYNQWNYNQSAGQHLILLMLPCWGGGFKFLHRNPNTFSLSNLANLFFKIFL